MSKLRITIETSEEPLGVKEQVRIVCDFKHPARFYNFDLMAKEIDAVVASTVNAALDKYRLKG